MTAAAEHLREPARLLQLVGHAGNLLGFQGFRNVSPDVIHAWNMHPLVMLHQAGARESGLIEERFLLDEMAGRCHAILVAP